MVDNGRLVITDDEMESTGASCPQWCLGETYQGVHDLHESTRVEWNGPGRRGEGGEPATLSASIALLAEYEDDGRQPEIWLGTAGGWCELDLPQMETVVEEVDQYALALRALSYRYAAALAGADLVSKPWEGPAPDRPVEITAPCPRWCMYRGEGHAEEGLQGRYHYGNEDVVELSLHHPEAGSDGAVVQDEVQVLLEQAPYSHLPAVQLTIEGGAYAFARLSLSEARQLRSILGKAIAVTEECATPDALPPLDAVVTDMRAKVVEDPRLDPRSRGYALGDSDPDGRTWVCVPARLSPELKEETVRGLLADVFEKRGRALWEGDASVRVIGDKAALVAASARAVA